MLRKCTQMLQRFNIALTLRNRHTRLMTELLDDRQQKFLDWLCTPSVARIPSSQEKYALVEGVDESTLRRWKKKPAFKAVWERRVAESQGSPERTQQLLDNLFQRALDGDNNSAKLYLQATGRLAPVQFQVEHSGKVSELSDAQLSELIAASAASEQQFRLDSAKTK
jgi:hypothetical protein